MPFNSSNPFDNTEGIVKRTMVLFFLVDTSGSMYGTKIGAVNTAIREVIPVIREISGENADAEIKVAALTFSSGASWMHENPVLVEDFQWTDVYADGLTDLGEAYSMLKEKLSRNAFMNEYSGSYAPAIFLMSDGTPTDEYKEALENLKKNGWFKAAIKVAVAIGDDADTDVLKEFTGNIETVLKARTPEALKKMIRLVSVTASKIGSQSSTGGDSSKTKPDIVIEQIKNDQDYIDWNDVVDDGGFE